MFSFCLFVLQKVSEFDGDLSLRQRVFVLFSFEECQFFRENRNIFLYAALYQLINVLVICIAVMLMIIDSAPEFRGLLYSQKLGISITETITIVFFVFDYTVRIVSCPKLLRFIIHPLNIVDLLVILPFFIQIGVEQGLGRSVDGLAVFNVLKLFRVVRVMRLMRFGKLSGLQTAILVGLRHALYVILCKQSFFFLKRKFSPLVFFSIHLKNIFILDIFQLIFLFLKKKKLLLRLYFQQYLRSGFCWVKIIS
jgi:hypothetical protein